MKRATFITCILLFALVAAGCIPVPISEEATATEEAVAPAEAPMEISCENSYEGESLTIYQQVGLTGPLATLMGIGPTSPAQDALDQINAEGGICGVMLNIRSEDTQYALEQEI
ncbi:MAG: hypothetical protein OXF76_20100 [Caldilineaceae bacterium]|nr:hypothetical protein [Caldilineaceae bacterium]